MFQPFPHMIFLVIKLIILQFSPPVFSWQLSSLFGISLSQLFLRSLSSNFQSCAFFFSSLIHQQVFASVDPIFSDVCFLSLIRGSMANQ
ncbi:hypothetical protein GLYMA_04G059250v4 [Glycine max]|nr:hypothetical protein GLYMA_04G059250v4 [Glycine max]KAH1109991.1 hypothetical protein GYH30_009074 [Glycine max]